MKSKFDADFKHATCAYCGVKFNLPKPKKEQLEEGEKIDVFCKPEHFKLSMETVTKKPRKGAVPQKPGNRMGFIKDGGTITQKCNYCGDPVTLSFNQRSRLRRGVTQEVYCNREHFYMNSKRYQDRPCKFCGKNLTYSEAYKGHFCNADHYDRDRDTRFKYRQAPETGVCANCGKTFLLSRNQRTRIMDGVADQFFCKMSCVVEWNKNQGSAGVQVTTRVKATPPKKSVLKLSEVKVAVPARKRVPKTPKTATTEALKAGFEVLHD